MKEKRTRSTKEFDEITVQFGDTAAHIPVTLLEVLDVCSASSGRPLCSFVDCTVGADNSSTSRVEILLANGSHPIALHKAEDRISAFFSEDSDLKAFVLLKNCKYMKSLLADSDEKPVDPGVDGILMYLGMSSMQAA